MLCGTLCNTLYKHVRVQQQHVIILTCSAAAVVVCSAVADFLHSLGADGVMVPLVNSRVDAEQAVSYCLFPPEGQRSAAYPVR